ncbi:MAG: trypsin-like serine protease [Clostridiales bacterium]|nr:trypsin-like serine protease [Clostridiales bacterium]
MYEDNNRNESAYVTQEQHNNSRGTTDKLRKYLRAMIAVCCVMALMVVVAGGALVYFLNVNNEDKAPSEQVSNVMEIQDAEIETSEAAPEKNEDLIIGNIPSGRQNNGNVKLYTDGSGNGAEMSTKEVVDLLSDAVVAIYTEYEKQGFNFYGQAQTYTTQGAGSGVIISSEGYIVTNNHVVEGAKSYKVVLNDGREFDASLVGTDAATEIALLKVEAESLVVAPLGDSDSASVGDKAIVIGNPLGKLQGTVTQGIISALDREITFPDGTKMNLMQTDAAVNSGNSGGALLSDRGELIGVVVAKTSASGIEGLGYAIPVNDIKPVLEDLLEYGYVTGRPALGISVILVRDPITAMNYRLPSTGVYVRAFIDPAFEAKSGLKIGDCILKVNGTEVATTSDIKAAISDFKAGDTVDMTVIRDNEEIDIKVLLTEENRGVEKTQRTNAQRTNAQRTNAQRTNVSSAQASATNATFINMSFTNTTRRNTSANNTQGKNTSGVNASTQERNRQNYTNQDCPRQDCVREDCANEDCPRQDRVRQDCANEDCPRQDRVNQGKAAAQQNRDGTGRQAASRNASQSRPRRG